MRVRGDECRRAKRGIMDQQFSDGVGQEGPRRTTASSDDKLSYKFQRLRERLREAIVSGEFCGKLPGERQLAKRFHVNAKTLSKALTDLAAEGLLDRSIGRGTYVKGSAPAPAAQGRWLALCEPSGPEPSLARSRLFLLPSGFGFAAMYWYCRFIARSGRPATV